MCDLSWKNPKTSCTGETTMKLLTGWISHNVHYHVLLKWLICGVWILASTNTTVQGGKSTLLVAFNNQTLSICYWSRTVLGFCLVVFLVCLFGVFCFSFQTWYKNWKRKQMKNTGLICADLEQGYSSSRITPKAFQNHSQGNAHVSWDCYCL